MSTIRTRQRWIRLQLVIITGLLVVLIFPSAPTSFFNAVGETPVYQKLRASIEEAYVKRKIESGDPAMPIALASMYASDWGHYKYMTGDPSVILDPLIVKGDLMAMRTLAVLIRKTDPEKATSLTLRAADMGDYAAQLFYMSDSGYDLLEAEAYALRLYDLQRDRPGWKISFDRTYETLVEQAKSGNEEAARILAKLGERSQKPDA